ncbi:LysR family transcriptional regulator [Pseudooceanicola sp. CBS1P-1]|uniref:LysR family transcriptional regulator n=1 Tax=Pseudooceanicola albus TaxID=2692189 RepID=A0A6L7G4Z2_9RHOB|nr:MULTISPECIES: LysR family transcriptional regulator [Pseudooceanicola]MBT9383007.1 LysR family transcriptional regulator [Pseudooceanicola endophyticus]MXN19195.1 LysR family transcriptional regulator [Pseudooceanicola albus]
MDNRAGEMQVFLRVVESGSFSGAARMMQMTPSTVSKLVARIETRLGVRLLERSTRKLALTEEGRIYYERSQRLLEDLDAVEQALSKGAASITGRVRVSASVGLGQVALEPLLPGFWAAYPNIVVDLSLSDEIVDLYMDRTDVAFRVGALVSSSLTARKLGTSRRLIVAAPDYLARHGTPRSAQELEGHACLGFNFRRSGRLWPLHEAGPLLANNGETVRRMALAGVGLARIGEFHIRADLAEGRLVEVLADQNGAETEDVHALFLGAERMPQRLRVFLDHMAPRLQAFLRGDPLAV